jgi:hypothetical protein
MSVHPGGICEIPPDNYLLDNKCGTTIPKNKK